MTFYETQPKLYTRYGHTAERPESPPDKSALFWDMDTGKLYAVSDAMEWIEINPDRPLDRVQTYSGNFTYADTPLKVLLTTGVNHLIIKVRVTIITPFDDGAVITIGDTLDTDRLMTADQINGEVLQTYETEPYHNYATPTAIRVSVSSGLTNGAALVYLVYDEQSNE